jgi:hypothetical protein
MTPDSLSLILPARFSTLGVLYSAPYCLHLILLHLILQTSILQQHVFDSIDSQRLTVYPQTCSNCREYGLMRLKAYHRVHKRFETF